MFQAIASGGSTTLYEIDKSVNPFVYNSQGSVAYTHNSLAYNPADNYLYAVTNVGDVLRIGSDGTAQNLGNPAGLPNGGLNSGEFGPDGFYYVTSGNSSVLYKINVATLGVTTRTLSRTVNVSDLALSNGSFYSVEGNGQLISIDPVSGVVTTIGPTGASGLFGAMFGAPNGVYGASNSGSGFYKFNTTTGRATRISDAPTASANDGAKCANSSLAFPVELSVTKTDNEEAYTAGSTVIYEILISNSGPFGMQGAIVDDPLPAGITTTSWTCGSQLGGAACGTTSGTGAISGEDVDLPAGSSVTYTITMQIPSDFTGDLVNTVTVTPPDDADDSTPADNTATDTDKEASMTLVKEGAFVVPDDDTNGNGLPDAGETISYTFTVTNTGGAPLTNVTVTDPNATITGSIASLAPGGVDSTSITGKHTVTQAEVDSGSFDNTASASALDPDGDPVAADSSPPGGSPGDATQVTLPQQGEMDLLKEAVHNDTDNNGRIDVGETLSYTFTVTNTGNVTLTDVTVDDSKVTVVGGPISSLAPGASDSTTFSAVYTVTQDDINAGGVENTAEVSAKDPSGNDVTKASRGPGTNPGDEGPTQFEIELDSSMTVTKSATLNDVGSNSRADAGDIIEYTFTVTNTGNSSLQNITLSDAKATISGGPIAKLDSEDVDSTTFTAQYILTQADIDAGEFENQATVTANAPDGEVVTDLSDDPADPSDADSEGDGEPDDPTVMTFVQESEMDLLKEAVHQDADGDGVIDVGETILYTFTVENTGNVTLTDVSIDDDKVAVTGGPIASLAPGEIDNSTFSGTYVITQADADAGNFDNHATANAKDPNGDDVTAESHPPGGSPGDATSLTIPSVADLQILKTGSFSLDDDANGNGVPDAGELVRYVFEVRNTGNVTISGIRVDDADADISGGPISSLAAGEIDTTTFTGSHVLTQAEVDAGEMMNQASAGGTSPKGELVKDLSDDPNDLTDVDTEGDDEPDDPTRIVLEHKSSMDLLKEATLNDANNNGFADAGETVSYAFTVTNTGNVSLTDIVVADDKATVSGSPITGPLAPGATDTSATGSYTITQADINSGSFENSATATGKDPSGNDVTAESHPPGGEPGEATEIAFAQNPALELDKVGELDDTNGNEFPDIGEKIKYTFTIRNTGNVTLSSILVSDPKLSIAGPLTTLDPGEEVEAFSGTYEITQDDIDSGEVENQATVEGMSQQGDVVQDLSDDPNDSTNVDTEGDGEPDDPTVFLLLENGGVFVEETGELIDANNNGRADAGEVIHYTFRVINRGNVTLFNVTLDDPSSDDTYGVPLPRLAPGEEDTTTFGEDHVITQADIDAGYLERFVVVRSVTPKGRSLEENSDDPTDETNEDDDNDGLPDDPTVTTFEQFPGLVVTLVDQVIDGDADGYPKPGDQVKYQIRVENIGNVTLKNVTIPELEIQPKDIVQPAVSIRPQTTVPVSGTVATLAPGEADDQTLMASYTLTAEDIEDGELDADARALAFSPKDEEVDDLSDDPDDPKDEDVEGDDEPDDITVSLLPQKLSLALEKTGTYRGAALGLAQPGDTILYSLAVTNDGNVPVSDIKPNDSGPLFGGKAGTGTLTAFTPATASLNPDETVTFTATYTLSAADIDNAQNVEDGIQNTATAEGTGLKGRAAISPESTAIVDLPGYLITKTAEVSEVRRGGRVPYTIRVKGLGLSGSKTVNIIDQTPVALAYVSGTAMLDGAPVTPRINGRRLVFENVTLLPEQEVEITLSLVATAAAKPDVYINRAWVEELDGQVVSRIATAEVEVVVEAVFDCGDILGKVFDDKNRNGYQDKGEPGLPGVRVATVKGLLVTSDPKGRFHVACAELPDHRIGTNYIMKLDPRSLPSGYRLITENPRVVRLTAGKASEFSFGAAVGRVVRVGLNDAAFEAGQLALRPEWQPQLNQLVALLNKEPSVLRLSYVGSGGKLARQRLKAVRRLIDEKWRGVGGRYRLEIESRVETISASP